MCLLRVGTHTESEQHNLSPRQLFVQGSLQMQIRGLQALDFFEEVDHMYGVDDKISIVNGGDEYTVHVPPTTISLSDQQLSQLHNAVNPLAESENFGIELYINALTTFVSTN